MLARQSLLRKTAVVSRLHSSRRVGALALATTRRPSARNQSGALISQRRGYSGCPLISNVVAHCGQVSSTTLPTVLFSPIGTVFYILLAYNIVYILTRHTFYTMELTAKDYVQDQELYWIICYGLMASLLCGTEVLFIEA